MSALGAPTINFPGEEVASQTALFVTRVPDEIAKSKTELKSDWEAAKGRGEDYSVMGGKGGKTVLLVLKKDMEEKDVDEQISKAAKLRVAKGEFAQEAASQVWQAVEPKIDEQKPENVPGMIWDKAKGKVQDKVEGQVAASIETACDEALKKQ
jgi:hypothetical protein